MKENETVTEKAERTVKRYMLGSLAVGVVPVPFVDLPVLTGIQLKMLHSLSNRYGVKFSKHLGKSIIASLLGGSVSVSLSSGALRLLKNVIPLGAVTSMVGSAAFGGASTYAVGKVFIQHFESGGTLLTFDPEKVRKYYAEQYEKGTQKIGAGYVGVKP